LCTNLVIVPVKTRQRVLDVCQGGALHTVDEGLHFWRLHTYTPINNMNACMHALERQRFCKVTKKNTHCSQISPSKTTCLLADKGDTQVHEKNSKLISTHKSPERKKDFSPFFKRKQISQHPSLILSNP
jgi:hypothetical protein